MNYRVCTIEDADTICNYAKKAKLNEQEMNLIQLYSNPTAVEMRIENKMEVAIIAEDSEVAMGLMTAVSSGIRGYWTIIFLHVDESHRRKKSASMMISTLENQLKQQYDRVKLTATLPNNDRSALACYMINGFDPEGKISTLVTEEENIVLGKKIVKEV